MLFVESTLMDYAVEASDGKIGAVRDFLFDDQSWKIRWLVLDAGSWLPRRKILLHPSVLAAPDPVRQSIAVKLTKAEVEGSPDFLKHLPVSRQMEAHLYDYYGWDPAWGSSYFGVGAIATPFSLPPLVGGVPRDEAAAAASPDEADFASTEHHRGYRLSCPRHRWRDRPCREFCLRSRQLGHPLLWRRHKELVARRACPDFPLCCTRDRLGGSPC